MPIHYLFLILQAGLTIDADSPCNLVQVRDVLQLGTRYFVLDKGEFQVKVTDERGELHYRFGHQGEGPGEFQYPSAIGAVNGEIWVHDQIQSHVQRFTVEGEYLGVHNISALGPLQFEPDHLVLHTPTQAHAFIVLNHDFKELGKVGLGMDAVGGVKVDQISKYMQAFTTDPDRKVLFSLGVNGKTFASYDLASMTLQTSRDLALDHYAGEQKVEDTGSGIRVSGNRPLKGAVFHNGHLFALIIDETEDERSRLVVLDLRGEVVRNRKLETFYTRIIGNPGHGSAFFINVDESLIEERPLDLDQ